MRHAARLLLKIAKDHLGDSKELKKALAERREAWDRRDAPAEPE
jgi:hypothetical protein